MPRQIDGEPFQRISVDEAAELHGSDDVAFVDVRRMDEYVEGHVEGAIFITVDDILSRIGELPEDKKLMFICALWAWCRSCVNIFPHDLDLRPCMF